MFVFDFELSLSYIFRFVFSSFGGCGLGFILASTSCWYDIIFKTMYEHTWVEYFCRQFNRDTSTSFVRLLMVLRMSDTVAKSPNNCIASNAFASVIFCSIVGRPFLILYRFNSFFFLFFRNLQQDFLRLVFVVNWMTITYTRSVDTHNVHNFSLLHPNLSWMSDFVLSCNLSCMILMLISQNRIHFFTLFNAKWIAISSVSHKFSHSGF